MRIPFRRRTRDGENQPAMLPRMAPTPAVYRHAAPDSKQIIWDSSKITWIYAGAAGGATRNSGPANTSRAAAMQAAIISGVWAAEAKPTSYCDGAR